MNRTKELEKPERDTPTPEEAAREPKSTERFRRQLQTLALALLVVVLVIHLLQVFSVMLQQLLVALFLIYLVLPFRNWLERYGLSGWLAYVIIIVAFLLLTWMLIFAVQESLSDFNSKWPHYEENLSYVLATASQWVPGLNEQKLRAVVLGHGFTEEESIDYIRSSLLTFLNFSGQLVIVLVYTAFLLAEELTLRRRLRRSFAEPRATDILVMMHRINTLISRYISVKTFVSFLTGAATTLVLWIFGVDYALLWGIITFLLNYIPYVGAVIAITGPSILAALQYSSPGLGVLIFMLLNFFQTILGYWLEPVLAGERLNLSPLVVILSLAFWASLWGVVGMIMAVPLMSSLKIILDNIPATRPIGGLLSNVPHDKKSAQRA